MLQSSATELQRLRPSAPAWLRLSALASALWFQRWGTYDLHHACSPKPTPVSPGRTTSHRTSPPIADRARVPQQQYGYHPPPQGHYGRPSEQPFSLRARREPALWAPTPPSNRMLAAQTLRPRTRIRTAMPLAHPQPPRSISAPAPPPTMRSSTRSATAAGRPCSSASTTLASAAS